MLQNSCIEHKSYAKLYTRSHIKRNIMFKKLVSNLPFSPALVGQLGFYASRLKKEEAVRRLGLIVLAFALVMQSFAVFNPPQSTNAADPSDLIRGGVTSVNQILAAYDNPNSDYRDIANYLGITRAELANMKSGYMNAREKGTGASAWKSWGRTPKFSASQGEVVHTIPLRKGGSEKMYSRPNYLFYAANKGTKIPVFRGYSAKIGEFTIIKPCANFATTKLPTGHPSGSITANCQTISGTAIDTRNSDVQVRVQVFAGGPPGKGELIYNQVTKAHKFSFAVPEKYKHAAKAVPIYGVMTPLPGYSKSTVDIGSASVPPKCIPDPVASCKALSVKTVERTKFQLSGQVSTADGATVSKYVFSVKDKDGKEVYREVVASNKAAASSQIFELTGDGEYSAKLVAVTSLGDKTSADCEKPLTVVPPEKCPLNPDLTVNDEDCKPCPDDPTIWFKDEDCSAQIVYGKSGMNLTQNVDVTSTTAKGGDRIEYTLTAENTGKASTKIDLVDDLSDAIEYADVVDGGGGKYDDATHTMTWSQVELAPGQKETRTIIMQIRTPISPKPEGQSNPASYDCQITNTFGNTLTTAIDCPPAKEVESVAAILPRTGATENMIFAGIAGAVVVFFYTRSRQLKKEVRLIRKDFNAGAL